MNALIFTQQQAETIIANQAGNHRLSPAALTDGTYFVMADVLTDDYFAAQLATVEYTVVSFESIQDLLPVSEEYSDEI